jgi:hypothetical protein
MSATNNQEAAYLVNDAYLLHLKEQTDGCHYEAFEVGTKQPMDTGIISWGSIENADTRNTLAAFREQVFDEIGMNGGKVAPVSINTLSQYQSDVRHRSMWEPDTLPKDIRFIDSGYKELFRIPDGGCIKIEFPDRQFVEQCKRIDDYHTYVGAEVFHICQFAELMERGGGKYQPEPESNARKGAWRLGQNRYLSIEGQKSGWKYSIYDEKFDKVTDGKLSKPELSINAARCAIAEEQELGHRAATVLGYDFVSEKAEEREVKNQPKRRKSVLGQLETLKSGSRPHAASAPKRQRQPER